MELLVKLQKDQLDARKRRNEIESSILTVLYSDAANIGKNQGNRITTDDEIIALIKKFIKTGEQNLVIYHEKNKVEAISQTEKELEILKRYMPTTLSEEDLEQVIKEIITINDWKKESATMGLVMRELKIRYGVALNGALASKLIKKYV
jgi:hypothetical protein